MEQPPIQLIQLNLIDPHPNNPRGTVYPETVEELAASIREKGIIEPLILTPTRKPGQNWKILRYTTVAGHRRRVAAGLAGLVEVPAIVRDLSPAEQEEMMLVENLQREDLTLLQEARAYQRLMTQHGLTQADVARRTGVIQTRVGGRIAILKLPETVQDLFDGREMPITAVPLLLKVEHPDRQERLAQMIYSRKLTVPSLKEMVEKKCKPKETDQAAGEEARRVKPKYSRSDAVADLERLNGAALRYSDMLVALNRVCHDCGMVGNPKICATCPLPQLVGTLARENAAENA